MWSAYATAVISLVFALVCVGHSSTHDTLGRFKRQSPCKPLEYACANNECIPSYDVCDGAKDCSDGSDETRSACKAVNMRCPALAFECAYGACIDRDLRCDGKSDCADGSDEHGCSNSSSNCQSLQYQCNNGQCINNYDICDGTKNCDDGSDETASLCKHLQCPSGSFKCDYGACIERVLKCNGQRDCHDGSDELCYPDGTTTPLSPGPSSGGCILPQHPNNGVYKSKSCQSGDPRLVCRNTPGTPVPENWLLKYSCNANYDLTSVDSEFSVCEKGVWKNPLDCIKLCPPLKSLSVKVKCEYNGQEVSCDKPMKPNTVATGQCKQHYKLTYQLEYSRLLCKDNGEWNYHLFYCTPDCGVSTKSETLSTLILNGVPTNQGEYPWLAALFLRNATNQWEQKCAGTLITPHIVLTAAHCLVQNEMIISTDNIKVGLGKYYRNYYKKEPYSVISDVKEVVIPRFYSGGASFYALDIGLLDLVVSVQVTAYIMPACVDWTPSLNVTSGKKVHVAGWGTTENGTSSDTILSTQLSYIDNAACIQQVRQAYKKYVTHDKFCAGTIDGSQVDKGDSGGGLTVLNRGMHFLIGVVSTKIQQVTSFSLFTDVTNAEHRSWLEENRVRLDQIHFES